MFGQGGNGGSSNGGGFGKSTTNAPFGTTTQQQQQQAESTSASQSSFFASPSINTLTPTTTFGTSPNVVISSNQPQVQPFGASAAFTPTISFGASPNLIGNANTAAPTASPFGIPAQQGIDMSTGATPVTDTTVQAPFSSPSFTTFPTSVQPDQSHSFGGKNTMFSPFGGGDTENTSHQMQSSSTFGFSTSTTNVASDGINPSTTTGNNISFGASPNLVISNKPNNSFQSPPPSNRMSSPSQNPFGGTIAPKLNFPLSNQDGESASTTVTSPSAQQEELAKLKAKLLEKKKKLQQAKKAMQIPSPIPETHSSPPSSTNTHAVSSNPEVVVASLAEKNATRFATNNARSSTALLPSDLQTKQGNSAPNDTPTNSAVPLTNATPASTPNNPSRNTSLVGICPYMCPDEELLRREEENDIQLLELPVPGGLHPSDWTLRDTVVKRFRRSAADFTLNIPELVRPPIVLEIVVGYLEEWVMERDRQGKDPRYQAQANNTNTTSTLITSNFNDNGIPPPLDVYQFIWDRTRMIRKDFILQNYIGTGGKCDAIAVRCHERICRWHACMEHQLSHLEDFQNMQSQQNIQELGQTMKTLNQYYDDMKGRATNDHIAEEDTTKRRSKGGRNLSSYKSLIHGCKSHCVMGTNPVDYDGQLLANNDMDKSANETPDNSAPTTSDTRVNSDRIIGCKSPNQGTSEAEMRGLYILLTINNDGGMEVLKYTARLSVEKPKIFNSKLVQLAFQIYKAKTEYNYARFFSILQSAKTPYLFACIMFKYVENMRKVALRIMNKTYGTKKKVEDSDGNITVENVSDAYPLKSLIRLLCYEDIDEARAACKHYNISVEHVSTEDGSNSTVDMIFWRKSEFREPRHPTKNSVIKLRPRKMIRTIESKTGGATRLAICRGEVSGVINIGESMDATLSTAANPPSKLETEESIKRRAIELQERIRRQKEEQQQKKAYEAATAYREEAVKREEKAARLLKEQEEIRQRLLREEARRKQLLEDKIRRKKFVEEEALRKQQEEARRQYELKRKQEEEALEIERKRHQELMRLHEEKEKKRKADEMAAAELERRRIREEQEAARRRKIKEMEETRRRLLEDERREKHKREIELARKREEAHREQERLRKEAEKKKRLQEGQTRQIENLFYRMGTDTSQAFDLSGLLLDFIDEGQLKDCDNGNKSSPNIILFKLGIVILSRQDLDGQRIAKMIDLWIDSRLRLGDTLVHRSDKTSLNVRFISEYYETENCNYDGLLFVTPPEQAKATVYQLPTELNESARGGIPHFHLNLPRNKVLDGTLGSKELDRHLLNGCSTVIRDYIDTVRCSQNKDYHLIQIERVSLMSLCCSILRKVIWTFPNEGSSLFIPPHLKRNAMENFAIEMQFNHALVSLFQQIESIQNELKKITRFENWPAPSFIDASTKHVNKYFSEEEGLPFDWMDRLDRAKVEDQVWDMFPSIKKPLSSTNILQQLIVDDESVPSEVKEECILLFHKKKLCPCFDVLLEWRESSSKYQLEGIIYLPKGTKSRIVESTVNQASMTNEFPLLTWKQSIEPSLPYFKDSNYYNDIEETLQVQKIPTQEQDTTVIKRQLYETEEQDKMNLMLQDQMSNKRKRFRRAEYVDSMQNKSDDCVDVSQVIEESKQFTETLKSLLDGKETLNIDIGDSTLSDILRDAEDILTIPR